MNTAGDGDEEANPMASEGEAPPGVEEGEGGSSEWASIFNLSNSILGSGTLAMPYACHQCGVVLFLVLLVLVGVVANFSLNLLVISLEENAGPGHMSYGVLAEKVIGRRYQQAASWAVILQQLGACVAYIVIIADVLQPIFGLSASSSDSVLCDRSLYQLSIAVCIIFPLCMLRSMEKLQYTSLLALLFISSFVVTVSFLGVWSIFVPETRTNVIAGRGDQAGDMYRDGTVHGAQDPHCLAATPLVSGLDTRAFNETKASYHVHDLPEEAAIKLFPTSLRQVTSAVPILCFAFLCHMNVFPIYNELAFDENDSAITHTASNREYGRSKKARMLAVGRKSFLFVGLVYACAGLFGYLCFLEVTKPDLLKNFKVSGSSVSGIMDVLRVGFGFALIFSYPIVVWEARHMLQQELLSVKNKARDTGVSEEYEAPQDNVERLSLTSGSGNSNTLAVPQRGPPLSKRSLRAMEVEVHGHAETSWAIHFLLNVLIVGGTTLLGVRMPTVLAPLDLIGGTCSPLIVFILPAKIFLGIESLSHQGDQSKRLPATVMMYIGVALIPITTVVTAIGIFAGDGAE